MSCSLCISMEQMAYQMKKSHRIWLQKAYLQPAVPEGSWFSDGTTTWHRDANLVKTIDTQGAGDSFLTAFFSSYIEWLKNGGNESNPAEKEKAVYAALDAAKRLHCNNRYDERCI